MVAAVFVLLACVVPWIQAIRDDFNCTTNSPSGFVWSPNAFACSNLISDVACELLYPVSSSDGRPSAGTAIKRPFLCYSSNNNLAGPPEPDMVRASLANCPKTCAFCCMTSDYTCRNVQFPRLNCDTITPAQCRDINWRTIIAEDCPSACGLCNEGGCVDGAIECVNDPSICLSIGLQEFVNEYCRRTCGRCLSTTTRSSVGACASFIADSSTSCRAWAANGFCTNNYYTSAQRRNYCATTCRIC